MGAGMNTWWSKLSLQNKLQIPIQLILLAIMVMAQRTAFSKFEDHVIEGARQKTVLSAAGVLNELPQGDMDSQVDGHAHQFAEGADEVSRFSNESLERANHKLEFISVSINQQRDASLDITRNVGQTAVMDSQSNAVVKRTVSAVKSLEDMAGQLNKAIGRFRV